MSYISFRLVPKSVTLNDLERQNGSYLALFHQIGSFRAHCVKVVEDMPNLSATKNVAKIMQFLAIYQLR